MNSPYGGVNLVRFCGSDRGIYEDATQTNRDGTGAWKRQRPASYDRAGWEWLLVEARARERGPLSAREKGVLKFMIREKHGSPFENTLMVFSIMTSIRVAREHQRHRSGRFSHFNELSTRWVAPFRHAAYSPPEAAIRQQVGKRAAYTMEPLGGWRNRLARRLIDGSYDLSFAAYQGLLRLGVAKELAAYVLPLGTATEYRWGIDLRNLWHFLALRNDPTALQEIRWIAQEVEDIASQLFPESFALWNAHGRVAP